MYITKLYKDKANRLRPLPLPTELSRRVSELSENVLVVIYQLKTLDVPLPWIVVKDMKRLLLNVSEDGIREYLGFLAHDVGNTVLRLVLPSTPSIMLRDPKRIEVIDNYIDFRNAKVKVRNIVSTGYWIYPPEKVTNSIEIKVTLYDIPDALDVYAHSHGRIIIKLDQLMKELGIRWDLGRR